MCKEGDRMSKGNLVRRIMQILGHDEAIRLAFKFIGADGGPGSGNFGHKGRPGKIGGSGGGGGKAFRTQNSEGSYVGVQKAAAFRGIKKVAQTTTNAKDFIHSLSKEQRDMVAAQHRQSKSKERIMDYAERLRQLMCSQKSEKTVPFKIVEGKDILGTSKWDGQPYTEPLYNQVVDTEIEHVIVQQGFNGPPKVVSQDEIMKIIKEHPEMPVLFRSYAALGEEAIQAYDDMLENGEWYVDCSNGGAQYGQGMYCAGVYGGDDYSGALSEMQHYRSVSMKNARARWTPSLAAGEDCFGQSGSQIVFRQDQMKKTEDQKPPNSQYVVAMVKTDWTTESVKGYFMPSDPEDDDSPLEFNYYTDAGGHQTVLADKVPYWGPIEREEKAPEAVASTRMMTLDPSAKIISYHQVLDLRKKVAFDKAVDEMRQTAEIRGESEKFEKAVQYCEISRRYEDASGILEGLSAEEQSQVVNMAQAIDEMARKKKNDQPRDVGVFAASLGYDAIYAEGHGDTDSYTVVLNRTKVILSQSRIDMAS